MTFEDIFEDVLDRLHQENSAAYKVKVKGWINRSYYDIQSRGWWHWLEAETTASTTADVNYVALAAACDRVLPNSVRISNDFLELINIYEVDIFDPNWSSNGQPTSWAPFAENMYLWPEPDAVYTINYRYIKNITALSTDASTPLMPIKFHEVLVLGAWMRGLQERDNTLFSSIEAQYERMIARMRQDNSRAMGSSKTIVKANVFQNW